MATPDEEGNLHRYSSGTAKTAAHLCAYVIIKHNCNYFNIVHKGAK